MMGRPSTGDYISADRERIIEILSISRGETDVDEVHDAIIRGTSADDFARILVKKMQNKQPVHCSPDILVCTGSEAFSVRSNADVMLILNRSFTRADISTDERLVYYNSEKAKATYIDRGENEAPATAYLFVRGVI